MEPTPPPAVDYSEVAKLTEPTKVESKDNGMEPGVVDTGVTGRGSRRGSFGDGDMLVMSTSTLYGSSLNNPYGVLDRTARLTLGPGKDPYASRDTALAAKLFPGKINDALIADVLKSGSTARPGEFSRPDGGTYKKDDKGKWQAYDKDGNVQKNKYGADILGVKEGKDGSLIVQLDKGRTAEEKQDGSTVERNGANQVSKIVYKDGKTREFIWDGKVLKSTKSVDGQWFDHDKKNGAYIDSYTNRQSKGKYQGKLDVNQESAGFTIAPAAKQGVKQDATTKNTDGSVETVKPDGSRHIEHQDKTWEKYDKTGNLTGFKTPDGVERSIKWKRGEDGRFEPSGITVKSKSGTTEWDKRNGTWYKDGKASEMTFKVDSKAGVYSFNGGKSGETVINARTGAKSTRGSDGISLESKSGEITKVSDGKSGFELVKKGASVVGIKEYKDGKLAGTWTPTEGGKWKSPSGEIKEGKPSLTKAGELTFTKGDTTVARDLKGKEVTRTTDAKTKVVSEETDKYSKYTGKDGSVREYTHETGKRGEKIVTAEKVTRAGKTEEWQRQKEKDGSWGDRWVKKGPEKTEEIRKDVKLDKGEFSYKKADAAGVLTGETYTARKDGTERIANPKEKWSVEMKDGRPTEIKYPDGRTRKLTHAGGQVKTMQVYDDKGKPTFRYERIGKDRYTYENLSKKEKSGSKKPEWNVRIEADRDKIKMTDFEAHGHITERKANGTMIDTDPVSKISTEKRNGVITAVSIGDARREFKNDSSGKPLEIHDKKTDTVLKREGDTWKLYDSKGKAKDDGHERKGEPVIGQNGSVNFLTKDGALLRHEIGKNPEKVKNDLPIEKKIVDNKHLTDKEKIQFLDYLDKGYKRDDIDKKEKLATVAQMERILDHAGKVEPGKDTAPYDAKKQAQLAMQLAWHVAHPLDDAQGGKPTCNVTDIRLALLHESPSVFAKFAADVITTGKFVTADKTTIRPPKDSLKLFKDSEESTFPPVPGTRTELAKLSDVTMINIHWNRRTTDYNGKPVAKGNMFYREVAPTDRNDSGSRLTRYDGVKKVGSDGKETTEWKGTDQKRSPGMSGREIMDVFRQITGKPEEGRYISYTGRSRVGPGVKEVSSRAELDAALRTGPKVKILRVENNILNGKPPDGQSHSHVVVCIGYDPKTGLMKINNSHHPSKDRVEPGKEATFNRVYDAMRANENGIPKDGARPAVTPRTFYPSPVPTPIPAPMYNRPVPGYTGYDPSGFGYARPRVYRR